MTDIGPELVQVPVPSADARQRGTGPGRTSWRIQASPLIPIVAFSLFGVAIARHRQGLAISAAPARGDAPPVAAVTIYNL